MADSRNTEKSRDITYYEDKQVGAIEKVDWTTFKSYIWNENRKVWIHCADVLDDVMKGNERCLSEEEALCKMGVKKDDAELK